MRKQHLKNGTSEVTLDLPWKPAPNVPTHATSRTPRRRTRR